MKKAIGTFTWVVAGVAILACVWGAQAQADAAKPAVMWPAADIKWTDNPAIKGAKIAVLWGDPKTGAYGALKKMPGGNTLTLHTHTYDQKVIILGGTVVLTMEGGAHKEMGAGSYAFIPGGAKHTAECKAGADCLYFEEQQGKSDINFVGETAPTN